MRAGRPREFDEQEVLERAMRLFWLRGYHGLGLSELVKEMGISRQSLYDTFGSKRELFIRAVERYRETQLAEALGLLQREGSPIENVRALLRFFEQLALDRSCRGCLVANTLVELGPHDEEIATLLEELLSVLQRAIEGALQQARERGELSPSKSPRELSRALTNAIIGISVTGKLPIGRSALTDIHAGTLSMLD